LSFFIYVFFGRSFYDWHVPVAIRFGVAHYYSSLLEMCVNILVLFLLHSYSPQRVIII
jgi:hypothetical protein